MTKYISILLLFIFLFSCSMVKLNQNDKIQLLADDLNNSIEDFTATYYRYPYNVDELYKFVCFDYSLDKNIYKEKHNVIKYLEEQQNDIYIYSTDNFMLFFGKKNNIVIDRTLGLCEWTRVDNYSIFNKVNSPVFFDENEKVIHDYHQEFDSGMIDLRKKYSRLCMQVNNNDTIIAKSIFNYKKESGLNSVCEINDIAGCEPFIDDLKAFLNNFVEKYYDIETIYFVSILKKK